jgi:pimeloyl-ACP methyl ester carboxylesterase
MGDRDPIAYSEASISELQSAGIRYEVIENAGHALNYEKPDIINTMMKEFLLG